MHRLSCHSVVDQIATELAERRRQTHNRRAAYLALAQAILNDEFASGNVSSDFERESSAAVPA
jgi:hypothetical protein